MPQVSAQHPEQLDRRGHVRTGDVVRYLREVADGRDASPRDRVIEHGDRGGRHAQDPFRPGRHVRPKESRRRLSSKDRHAARVGHGRRNRSEADPLGHAKALGEVHRGAGKLPPAEVRFGAGEDNNVALADLRASSDQLGPRERCGAAVHDVQGGTPRAVVVQAVVVESRDGGSVGRDVAGRRCGGRARIHPSIEGRDHHGGDEAVGVLDLEQDHARKHTARVVACRTARKSSPRHAILESGASHPPN